MTIYNEDENAFLVHILVGYVIKFICVPLTCLYYFYASNIDMSKLKLTFSLLNTVSNNMKHFRNQEVRKATDAVILNQKKNHIAKDKFVRIVNIYLDQK